jgi:hypothetical protein
LSAQRGETLVVGRLGTHDVECHFGLIRSVLRGQAKWTFWKWAEAYNELLRRWLGELGLRQHGRSGRLQVSGAHVPLEDPEGAIQKFWQTGYPPGAFALVMHYLDGGYKDKDAPCLQVKQYLTDVLGLLVRDAKVPDPGDKAGAQAHTRQFWNRRAASETLTDWLNLG